MFQRQDLATVSERTLGQEAQLREAVDHDPRRSQGVHLVEDHLSGFAKLHFRGLQDRQFLGGVQRRLGGHELEDGDALEGPAVSLGHQTQFALRLRQRDVEARLASADAFQQELQSQRCLAGARLPFEQVHPLGIETASEDVVQAGIAGRDNRGIFVVDESVFTHGKPQRVSGVQR